MTPISSPSAPAAIGPYSQAQRTGNLIFASGQLPLNPETMKIEAIEIEDQTRQVLKNIAAVLSAEGLTLANVVKCTVFMQDLTEFTRMNPVYAEIFGDHKPARSTFQVARLPMDAKIEIEVIAEVP